MTYAKSLKYSTAVAGITALLAVPFIVGDVTAAEDNRAKLQTEQTANNGRVKLTGTIDNIYSNRNFTLRDHRGNTIQVRSDRRMELREGDRVQIIGRVAATDVKVLNRDASDDMSGGARQYSSIEELPAEGRVTLVGIVTDDVQSGDRSLVIRDMNDDTIDVHFDTNLQLREGSTVRVTGEIEDEALGFGEQIVSARIQVTDRAAGDDSRNNNYNRSNNDRSDMRNSNMDRGDNRRDNVRDTRDMNAERNSNDENQNRRMAANDQEKSGGDDAVMDAYRDAKENLDANKRGEMKSAIDALPQEGNVSISGIVSSVEREDRSFTLRDNSGQTIDVHTRDRIRVAKGDSVRVRGVMKDEALGMGEQIVQATVTRNDRGAGDNARRDANRDRSDNENRRVATNEKTGAEKAVNKAYRDAKETLGVDETGKKVSAIDALPQEGNVMISGMVSSVEKEDRSFTLRDDAGQTIDVHTRDRIRVTKGDMVRVEGIMQDEALGLGEQIVKARVKITKQGNAADAERAKKRSDMNNKAYEKRANNADTQADRDSMFKKVASVAGDDDGQVSLSGTVTKVDKGERKFNLRDASGAEIEVHTSHAFTLREGDRVEVSGKAANIVAATAELVARAGEDVARNQEQRDGREYSAIEALPQEGNVMITGTVDSIERNDGRFILRDKSGATIDVHSEGELNITRGTLVRVNGVMSDEALGLGEQIVSARVQVVDNQ